MDANVENVILKPLILIQEDIREIRVELNKVKSELYDNST